MENEMAEAEQIADRPPRRRFFRALAYLLLNLPIGVAGFSILFALTSLGFSLAVVLIGLPLLGLTALLARSLARMERARVHTMLGTYIPAPHLVPSAGGQFRRWTAPLRDGATWRDLLYVFLLFPLGVLQFSLVVGAWSVSVALLALPVFYHFVDDGAYRFPSESLHWVTVDTPMEALPWAALGFVFAVLSVLLTRGLAVGHARFARALLAAR
ncbi:sensor domain-containing protein [Amycolatopsis magusensis]|uniref:sensor domain-containing protein n=1 Tax=Amycolatopsis magusensis TaxID=882444 RepID=UPI0037AAB819